LRRRRRGLVGRIQIEGAPPPETLSALSVRPCPLPSNVMGGMTLLLWWLRGRPSLSSLALGSQGGGRRAVVVVVVVAVLSEARRIDDEAQLCCG